MATNPISGQVLVEACLGLPFVLLTLGFGLDVVRRAQFQMAFHHAACVGARELALKGDGDIVRPIRRALARFGAGSSGATLGTAIRTQRQSKRSEVTLHYRYPQFGRFPWGHQTKHHAEVSESCSFPTG